MNPNQLPKGVEVSETGHASMQDRCNSAARMLNEVLSCGDCELTNWEREFTSTLQRRINDDEPISARQYFKLKDIFDSHVSKGH